MVDIRALRDDELGWADERYREIKFMPSPPGARGFVAELEGGRVGLGRLIEHAPEVLELGGIWTDDHARGRGVARDMVTALLAAAPPGPVWCIPFAHLAGFYETFGFEVARPPWPASIASKVALCHEQHLPSVVVLVRSSARA